MRNTLGVRVGCQCEQVESRQHSIPTDGDNVIDDRHANELLMAGARVAGLRELRRVVDAARVDADINPAELARGLVYLSYQLRFDNVTGEYHPESFAECESVLTDAEAALAASPERADGWAWLGWHTAARGLFLVQDRADDAVAVTDRQLARIRRLDDPDGQTIMRLGDLLSIDSGNA